MKPAPQPPKPPRRAKRKDGAEFDVYAGGGKVKVRQKAPKKDECK